MALRRTDESSLSDAELLRGSVTEPELFGHFYDRHVNDILSFFMSRTACAHTASDLTAETFAKALVGSHRFEESRGPARAWLFGIARHELAYTIRRQKVRNRAMKKLGMGRPELDAESLDRIESLLDSDRHIGALKIALMQLPKETARAIVLRIGRDLPFSEVARELNCSEGAARVRVSRGLAQLHDLLAASA